jgi:uncharacterized repeat protein (TIGR01451 family)
LKTSSTRGSRRRAVLSLVIGTALLLAALPAAAQAHTEAFQALAPSPTALTSVAADPTTSLIYAQENNGNKFFVYDPRTDRWSELAPAPLASGNNGGGVYLGGKIYTSYTQNSAQIGVYDIASNSWTTVENPLHEGTADITAGDGKIFMAEEEVFVSYEPLTASTSLLADPPSFTSSKECDEEGFEAWGGLQFDGNKIYGHEGDGCTGFAVYDIPSNSWTELASVPDEEEGAILGSAFDPVTNTYLTYGGYDGATNLYRYDIEAGTWSTSTLPFENLDDGGMAYISLPGFEGVYMIEGEGGVEFTRYTERNVTDLSTSMSAAAVPSASGGSITYSIAVKNNGPERAGGVVLSDTLPAGTSLVSVASAGACTGSGTIACSLGGLPSGATANLTIRVTAGFGTVTNTAAVSSTAIDTNPANDSASVASTFTQPIPVKTAPRCVVPKVKGLKAKGAKKALRAAHCAPGKVKHRHNAKVKKGKVIRGAKKRGTALPAGTKVALTVSSGPKAARHHARHAR